MFIESIILHNYRAYKGHNQTSFKQDAKNIFLLPETMVLVKLHFSHPSYGVYMAN